MKKLMIPLLLAVLITTACSKDEQQSSEISYGFQNLEVDFWSTGEAPAPMVQWNGESGTFSLKNPVKGIAIDVSSGVLSWQRSLDLGTNPVVVVAQNSREMLEIPLTIESVLGQSFWLAGENNAIDAEGPGIFIFNRQLTWNEDGTIDSITIGEADSEGVGVWSIEGNEVEIHLCSFCSGQDPFGVPDLDEHRFYSGTLENQGDEGVFIGGQWFVIRFDPDSTTLRGQFSFRFTDEDFSF